MFKLFLMICVFALNVNELFSMQGSADAKESRRGSVSETSDSSSGSSGGTGEVRLDVRTVGGLDEQSIQFAEQCEHELKQFLQEFETKGSLELALPINSIDAIGRAALIYIQLTKTPVPQINNEVFKNYVFQKTSNLYKCNQLEFDRCLQGFYKNAAPEQRRFFSQFYNEFRENKGKKACCVGCRNRMCGCCSRISWCCNGMMDYCSDNGGCCEVMCDFCGSKSCKRTLLTINIIAIVVSVVVIIYVVMRKYMMYHESSSFDGFSSLGS